MPPRKRIKIKQDPDGINPSSRIKKSRTLKSNRISRITSTSTPSSAKSSSGNGSGSTLLSQLEQEFIHMFQEPQYKDGVSSNTLKEKFGETKYPHLVGVINKLMKASKLNISRLGGELFYQLVSDDLASKLSGLDETSKMVYQFIERAGNLGIWTKDIKMRTNVHQQTLNKIIKALESRKLVKPVKSVNSKTKNLYMLYNLIPAEEITGGAYLYFIGEVPQYLLRPSYDILLVSFPGCNPQSSLRYVS